MSETKVKLVSVQNVSAQGVALRFTGLKHFNEKWFSWEHIATKMLGVPVEAANVKATTVLNPESNSDDA